MVASQPVIFLTSSTSSTSPLAIQPLNWSVRPITTGVPPCTSSSVRKVRSATSTWLWISFSTEFATVLLTTTSRTTVNATSEAAATTITWVASEFQRKRPLSNTPTPLLGDQAYVRHDGVAYPARRFMWLSGTFQGGVVLFALAPAWMCG